MYAQAPNGCLLLTFAEVPTAGPNEHITTDALSTRVPQQVIEPHGRNSFAIGDGAIEEKHPEVDVTRTSSTSDDLHPAPTEEETRTLRRVSDGVPMVIWLICVVEFAERASYYGAKTVFSNFMQYPLPEGGEFYREPCDLLEADAGARKRCWSPRSGHSRDRRCT